MASSLTPADFLHAFERSSDGVYAVDYDQNVVFWNRTAERILGHRAADVLGRKCFDLIAGGDFLGHPFCGEDCDVIRCSRKGKAPPNYDVRTHTAAGEGLWLNMSIVVLRGRRQRSTLTVHLFRDVTAERRRTPLPALRDAIDHPALARLTRRETEVLQLLAAGYDNENMAESLGVARSTLRNHIEHLLAKLGVHSRLEAVVLAARHRIV
jgi:PAS domain S-box-containing protein